MMRLPQRLTFSIAVTTIASLSALWAVSHADAVATRVFRIDSGDDFAAGELIATTASSYGDVRRGVGVRRVELPEAQLASSFVQAPNGDVYVGTGQSGQIFLVRGDAVTLFAETDQLLVSSLALGSGGELFAGTLPEGRIYRVDSGGAIEEIVRPEGVEHIWDLVWDPRRQRLFAATGPHGQIFAISRSGEAELYYDGEASHIMCLALDEAGALFAGTDGEALLLKLTGPGRVEVVHDFPGNELTALDVRGGVVAVAANEFPAAAATLRTKTGPRPAGRPVRRPRTGKGRLWRVELGGRVEQVFAHDDGHFTAVQISEDGAFFVGAAKGGRVHRVEPDGSHSTYIDVDERQVLALGLTGEDPLILTGDAGSMYRVLDEAPGARHWTSAPLDAAFASRWGQLTWRADGDIVFQTRSGNTAAPDDSWTAWSSPMTSPGPVRSPGARYVQVRADFRRDADAVLRAVDLYYLPQNQRARVHSIEVETRTSSSARLTPTKSKNKAATKRSKVRAATKAAGARTRYKIRWKVINPDEDQLRYRLRFRADGQERRRTMFTDDTTLTATEFTWETDGVPDGWYLIEVEASDELENPEELTIRTATESEPVLIDNHAPRIEGLRLVRGEIAGRAVDAVGPISRLECAIDGATWQPIHSDDGILDTREEAFRYRPRGIEAGAHIIAIRATDHAGNRVTAEVEGAWR